MRQEYYEAIIQIRPGKKSVLDFVENQIKKENIHVAKIEAVKTGVNYYVSSNRFAINLGRKLRKSFNGSLKLSRSLYGKNRQTSKMMHRVTICFRLEG